MASYTVTTHTGNRIFSGTTSYVYIQLRGADAESQEENLHKRFFSHDFCNGSERTFTLECEASLGELIYLKLRTQAFLGLDNQWFCDKITVKTPEGDAILFPCYRWLGSSETVVLRPAKALLVFQDTNPVAQKTRTSQLEGRQKLIRWSVYAENLPRIINYESAMLLPEELQFSFSKETEFSYTARTQLIYLKLNGLADNRESWESIDQLHMIHCDITNKTIEYVEDNWDKDEFFGYQFLNGLNPMLIQRCSKVPENFLVTEEMVKGLLGETTLKAEIAKGNIFLCDYKMLDGLVGNVVAGRQQYHTAPLVLLYCNPQGLMLPLAIQLGQMAGPHQTPIFLPTDPKHDWLLAKIFVRAAEFSMQELDSHLLRTHFLSEVFAMATLRNLPSPHPLFKLLIPHTRYTLHINILARSRLISDDGAITLNAGIGGKSLPELLKRGTSSLTYSSLCLPENISERGLEDVPNYYYRDDGIQLWNIINKYVTGVLQHYYTSDEHVQKDTELQSWIREIFTNGFLERSSTGVPESFQTVSDLIKFVTMVIFTASAQHAAVNNGQFDFGGWMPNYPTALRKPPPKEKGQTTMDTILETLPDIGTTVNAMAVLSLLSKTFSDQHILGSFPEDLFDEEVPCKIIADFQKDLRELSDLIEERNKKLEFPYTYLSPRNVENSVAI
ncbi:polyunsaturated fatty acid lipoxygenase ALOX15B-like [Alosa pseudoharengus]|uniref:polyunsaturated fatty acid lipoxygenase ALOX15B-like n=1 Tax=Alosa pseudoharengus TaxID=34774 RepID=UPI003F8B0F64